jgi:hypothetical protein
MGSPQFPTLYQRKKLRLCWKNLMLRAGFGKALFSDEECRATSVALILVLVGVICHNDCSSF